MMGFVLINQLPGRVGVWDRTRALGRSAGAQWAKVALALPLLAVSAVAQDAGRISGVVQDASGAVIPGATITAQETQTGLSRSAETNAAGQYVFPSLRPTVYTVRAETAGFQTSSQTGLVLDASASVVQHK